MTMNIYDFKYGCAYTIMYELLYIDEDRHNPLFTLYVYSNEDSYNFSFTLS